MRSYETTWTASTASACECLCVSVCARVRACDCFRILLRKTFDVFAADGASVCDSVWERVVCLRGLVVNADDLPAALLSPVDEQLGFPLLLHGHGRSVQHCRHRRSRRDLDNFSKKSQQTDKAANTAT